MDLYSRPPHGGVFITGTDTQVGKTVVTAALGVALQRQGYRPAVMKPIETGAKPAATAETDSERLHRLLSPSQAFCDVAPFRFPDPIAPLAASRTLRQAIDFARIQKHYEVLTTSSDIILVEGVGGVLVPLTETQTVRDLITQLNLPCLIVSRAALGSINHTFLTIEALHKQGITVLAILLNRLSPPPSTEEETLQIESTRDLLQEFSDVPVLGPLSHEPLISIDWLQGVMRLVEHPVLLQVINILKKKP